MSARREVKPEEGKMRKLLWAGLLPGCWLALLLGSGIRSSAQNFEPVEVGAGYSYVRANAGPGECGCFSMNGGSAWFAYHFMRDFAVAADVGSEYASNINGTALGLTLTSYLAGPRYVWHYGHLLSPFAQALVGGAHANGDLTLVRFGVAEPANSLALAAGGGADMKLTRHWAARGEVDYFLTRFSNGVNDHQNNLRVSVGLVYRFGGKKRK